MIKTTFDIRKLKGKLALIRDWMAGHHVPPKLLFFLIGIISTIWFLMRVIPKPSRASYPCMRVVAPFMSGLITYLIAVGGLTFISVRAGKKRFNVRYASVFLLTLGMIAAMAVTPSGAEYEGTLAKTGPDDLPNQPFGKEMGLIPGRVVWVWDPEATNEKCSTNFDSQDWFWKPGNTNEKVVGAMFRNGLLKLSNKETVAETWDDLFRNHNKNKFQKDKGYTKGEKIFIKINQGTVRWVLTQEDKDNGYYVPKTLKPGEERRKRSLSATETGPYIALELLRELVNEAGIDQSDIAIGDPMSSIYGHNFDIWYKEFPNVIYVDKFSTMHHRTLIKNTEKDILFYSDKTASDKIYDIVEKADYFINLANLKPHGAAGVSLTAKNHFGDTGRPSAGHLHYSHPAPGKEGYATNAGYHKYRVFVDLMGSKYLGRNTMLYLVDGLFGGGASETKGPVKYFMSPFNNDWSNSIFFSLDQVAIESVCFDFLRAEWNGVNSHNPSNNEWESMPNTNGIDDYLHQAADRANWPDGIIYDPDNSGKPLSSLGVHEHWNDPERKQYSRNLGKSYGIELVSLPETLVNNK